MMDIKRSLADMADAIKGQYRPSEVVGQFVKLRRAGVEMEGLCPFHGEKSPSFKVNDRKGVIHCFGCGWHGDVIAFYAEIRGIGASEAIRALASDAGIDDPAARERLAHKARRDAARREADLAAQKQTEAGRLMAIWQSRLPVLGAPVADYLASRKVLPDVVPPTLGFLPDHPYWNRPDKGRKAVLCGRFPVMVAIMLMPDRRFAGLHMTYLAPDGSGKAQPVCPVTGEVLGAKKVRSALPDLSGAGIWLTPIRAHMAVSEGIENGLTWMLRRPDWGIAAAYSLDNLAGAGLGEGRKRSDDPKKRLPSKAPRMARPGFRPPYGDDEYSRWKTVQHVQRVTVLADNDSKDPVAAACLFERARRKFQNIGYESRVLMPPAGMDFNDMVRGM
ncbi:CHC2 zinc finger domain-containing protein [uncultured Thalassospira sp.]|uniref:CHC2 zinc finger domain-containing protein n=1 Tax=uncultured Thalassospira sp. TaxID=404382 RepID=UPI0030D8EB1A|tara:strand:+ start:16944 stop:18110 length:1167 start_codon:yes stop_codon:yes gene_type:complete